MHLDWLESLEIECPHRYDLDYVIHRGLPAYLWTPSMVGDR